MIFGNRSNTMKNHNSRQPTRAAASPEPQAKPTHEQIAARAHALYEASGCLPGHDLENWLQAETELLQR
jgi:hypothetical protein